MAVQCVSQHSNHLVTQPGLKYSYLQFYQLSKETIIVYLSRVNEITLPNGRIFIARTVEFSVQIARYLINCIFCYFIILIVQVV